MLLKQCLQTSSAWPWGSRAQTLDCTWHFTIEPDEFVQILHDGSAHWVTISTTGCKHPEVWMFDSLYCTLSPALKHQIAALLVSKEQKKSVQFMEVQMQAGGSDCGLFAIAFATSLCYGQSPGKFHFETGHFEMFPIDQKRQSKNKVKATKTILLWPNAWTSREWNNSVCRL